MRAKYILYSFFIFGLYFFGGVNNAYGQTCNDLPPFSAGSDKFPAGFCSPVTATFEYRINFATPLPVGPIYRVHFAWRDGSLPAETPILLPGVDGVKRNFVVTANHTFPTNSDCEYEVEIFVRVNGARCNATLQKQFISTWRTDEFNQGNVQLITPGGATPGTRIHEVCEGVDINVTFQDLTDFNCNANYPANYPITGGLIQGPNFQQRWQQIIYNTPNGPARIPNVSVNGVLMPAAAGSNYVDPRTSGGTPAGSGVHVLPTPVIINDPDRRNTLPITSPGGFGGGFPTVGQEFEVTIRYWNFCNPYDDPLIPGPPANIINGDNAPIERTALIRIIDAPDRPTVPNREICEGESRTLTVTSPLTPANNWRYRWFSNATLTNEVHSGLGTAGSSWTPGNGGGAGQINPGQRKHWWVTVEAAGAGSCRSEATEVTLTRRSTLPQPGTITGPVNLCPSTTGNVFSVPAFVPNDPPIIGFTDPTDTGPDPDFTLNTEYIWTLPAGWSIVGPTNERQISVTTGATVGAGTVSVRLQYTTNTSSTSSRCQSTARDLAVNLRARPTATVAPNPVNICEGSPLQLNATPTLPPSGGGFNPAISAHTWSGNTVILSDATIEDPNILTTTGDGTYNVGYIVTADFGNSVFCSSNIVNVPVNISNNPGAATVGINQQICFAAGPLTSGSLGGNIPTAGTGTWSQVSGPGTSTFSGGVNNPAAEATVTLNGIYVFRWRIVSGTCDSEAFITVDYGTTPPTSNAGTPQDVCSATRTTTLNGNDPTFATGTWTQVSGPGTTTFVNANLRNTSITASVVGTYEYRWTIASGSCPPSSSTVQVIFRNPPVVDAQANFAACVDSPPTAAFHIPITGTFGGGATNARWERVSGTGTFASSGAITGAVDNTSPVADTYIPTAADYTAGTVTLRLITDDPTGQCIAVSDNVIITIDRRPAAPNAGTPFSVCGPSATMAATAVNTVVTPGAYGTWTGPAGVTFVDANSPTTVVNGLPDGTNTTLRWTVRTAASPEVCAPQFAEVIVTRNTLPANIDPLPERCVDIPGGTEAEFTLADLVALNDEITGITGSTNRTVEFFTDAARTTAFTGPADFENGDIIYTRVTRTDVTPNCPRDGQITFVIFPRPGVSPQAPEFCEDFPVGSNTHAGIDLTSYNNAIKNNVGANTVAWFTNAARTISVPTPTNVTANNGTKFYARVTNPTTTCSDTTSLEVIVNPRPVPNPLIGPTNVCVDASSAIVYQLQTNNVGAGYTFNWTIPAPPFVQMLGGTSSDYLVLMNFPSIVNPGQDIEVTEISDKGCSGDPNIINVSVETSPPPIVITSAAGTGPGGTGPFAVCENQSGVVFTVANLANTTYSWTVPAGSSVISGQGNNQITVNFGVVPGVIAVTPTTTTGCAGTPANGSVAINARPALDVLSNSVCSDTPGEITLSGTGAASFNITNVSISAGLSPASRPTGNGLAANAIFNDVFTNNTGGSLLVQYTVVPVSAQGCTGDPRIVNLTIEPEPVLNPNLSDAICSVTEDVNIVLTVAVGSTAASSYRIVSIINPDVANVTQVAGVQAVPGDYNANILTDDRWRNVGVAPVIIIYMVHPVSASGCLGDPAIPVRVTVYPEPHVAAASETICSGDIPSITLTTSPLIAGSTFTWAVKSITGVITGATSGSGATITNQLVNNDVTPGTVTYEVRATGSAANGGCQGPPTDVVITVNPAPLTTNVDKVECSTTAGTTEFVENLVALQPAINANGTLIFSWHTSEADALGNVNAMSVATASAFPLQNGIPVFVRVSNGQCARVMAVTYTIHPTPSFSAAITSSYNGAQLSCNTSSNGIITVTPPTNGTSPYLYSIDGGTSYFTSLTFNGLSAAGNPYVVQVRDARGCIAQAAPLNFVPPPVLTATPAITSNFNGQHIRCQGDNNGEVTVTTTGGTGAKAYSILELPGNNTGATSGIFTGLTAGSYTFVVRDANLCSVTTTTITLIDPPAISATAVLTSPVVCFGESNGIITVTATGGTLTGPTYTYTISPGGTSNTTGVFNGLGAGTYVVNVTDNNTCVRSSNSVTVTQPSALTAFASVTSNYNGSKISCPGANDAVITVIANGGNAGYSYLLIEAPANTTGNATGIYTGVGIGNYTVRVTDAQNCTVVTVPVNITEPLPIDATATIIQNISCNGGTNGQIRVTAVGGTGAYSYEQISPAGPTNATGIFTSLGNGTYDFRVTDLNGCTDVVQLILNEPLAVTASAAVGNSYNGAQLSCHNSSDGVITVTAGGGTGALHYVFDQFALTNTTGSTSGVFTGVPAGANYTFTVRDANNCNVVTVPVTVTPPTAIVASGTVTSNINGQHISCPTATDGQITVIASGGTGTYTYRIDQLPLNTTGQTTGIFTGIGAGVYTATVRDLNNCFIVTAPITVTAPPAVTASTAITSNYSGRHISCFGAADGIITVTAGGGVAPYTYLLNENPANTTGASTGVFSGLIAGSYTVTVTDLNGCPVTTSAVTLTQPAVLAANGSVTSNYHGQQISCFGASDGTIRIIATGGTGAYNYVSDDVPANVTGATTGIFTGLPAGSYTFTVEDVNTCSVTTTTIVISEPPVVNATAAVTSNYNGSQISCTGSSDGIITVTASGGTGVLNYIFNEDLTNTSGSSSGTFTGIPAGVSYTFTVTDLNGCSFTTLPVSITDPLALAASGAVTSNYNGQHITCPSATDGIITITANGGTGDYTYRIDQLPLNTTGLNTGIFTGIGVGSYTATVRDENGCFIITASITVIAPPAVTATAAVTSVYNGGRQITCFGASDGEITVTPGGGVAPYTFVITTGPAAALSNTTGAANGIFTGLPAGSYTFTVTDDNGCPRTTSTITISEPAIVAATAAVTSNYNGAQIRCIGDSNGIIRVTATGGTLPYTYAVVEEPTNTTGQANGIFTGLSAIAYTFTVVDANGCNILTLPVTITPPTQVVAAAAVSSDYLGQDISCNGSSDGQITVTASGGTGDLRYVFDQFPANQSGQFSGIFSNIPAGVGYTFTVTDVNNCSVQTAPIDVVQPAAITGSGIATSNFNGFNISCFTETDGQITVTASGGNGALTYMLLEDAGNTSGTTSGVFDNLRAGSFRARITDINGCSFTTAAIVVTQPANLTITIAKTSNYNGFDVSCDGAADGQISVTSTTGGSGGYTYVLNEDPANVTGLNSGVFTGLVSGLYSVTVTDVNGCTRGSIPVFLSNPIPLFEGIIGLDKQVCDGVDPTIFTQLAAPLGGIGNYTYQWQDSVAGGAWADIATAQSALFDPPIVAQTTYYRRMVSSGTCATLASNVVTVTVNPLPEVVVQSFDPYVCEGQPMILFYEFTQGQAPFYFSYTANTFDQGGAVIDTDVVVDELSGDEKPIIKSPFVDDMEFTVNGVRDFNGCVATVASLPTPVFVEVLKTKADFSVISPDPQCSGSTFTVEWSAEADVQYTWEWPDDFNEVRGDGLTGVQTASRNLFSQNPSGIQTLPIILNAENTMHLSNPAIPSCGTVTTIKNIRIYPAILPNIVLNPEEVCSGTPVRVQNNTLGGATHRWTITQDPNGTPQVLAGYPLTRTSPTTESFIINNQTTANPMEYEILYQIENTAVNGNCSKDTTVTVRVYRENIANVEAAAGSNFIFSTPPKNLVFDNLTTPVIAPEHFDYTWIFSNNNVNTPAETRVNPVPNNQQSYDFMDPGPGKRVTLTTVNRDALANGLPNGCATTDVLVFELTVVQPVAAFVATPEWACLPATIEVDNQSTGSAVINDWTVYDANNNVVTSALNQVEPSFQLNMEGTYTIILEVRAYAEAPISTAQRTIRVFENPVAGFVTSPNQVVFVPDQELFTINRGISSYPTIDNPTFEWDFGDGSIYTDKEPVHKYDIEGNYIITSTIIDTHTDGLGNVMLVCKDTAQRSIQARASGFVNVPNAFTPNRGGPTGGVVDNTGLTLNDVFLPATKGVREFQMQIFDRWGNMVFESKEQNRGWDGYDRNGNLLPSGVYVYKLVLRMANERRITQVGDVTLIR